MSRFGEIGKQYLDDAGDPLISGKLYFYESGTSTAKDTYADVNHAVLNTNPVILTAAGRQPNIFFNGTARATLTKSDETQVEVRDPVGETSVVFGAAWQDAFVYSINDVVLASDGEFYKSTSNGNQGNDPTLGSGWSLTFSIAWSATITYALNASVLGSDGILYASTIASNLNNDPVTGSNWKTVGSLAWESDVTYVSGAVVTGSDQLTYTSLTSSNLNNNPTTTSGFWSLLQADPIATASGKYYAHDNFGAF